MKFWHSCFPGSLSSFFKQSIPVPTQSTGNFRKWLVAPWFHGPITREQAEERLGRVPQENGCFLVRESVIEKQVVVSLWWNKKYVDAMFNC
jgi:hypothetical protein